VIVGLRLGNIKKFKRHAPAVLRSTLSTTEEKHIARFQETVEDPDAVSDAEKKDVKVYYVVIRSFPDFSQADAYKQKLRGEKFNADVFYNPADKKFHVHVLKTSKAAEANEEVKNLKSFTKLKDARLMTVTERK
jgi:cell division septation protein DedD